MVVVVVVVIEEERDEGVVLAAIRGAVVVTLDGNRKYILEIRPHDQGRSKNAMRRSFCRNCKKH